MSFKQALTMLLVLVGGCASAPKINYYTLAMEPSGGVDSGVNLAVERFRTTEALTRSQILIHSSATEIEYYGTEQWAGSLGELVQQKLSEEFGPPVEGRSTAIVSGTVLAFEQVDRPGGAEARLKLHVVVRDAERKRYEAPLLEKTYSKTRSAPAATAAAVVGTLSQCLEEVAAEIADDVSRL